MPLTCDASCNVESSAAKLKKFYVKKAHWITRHTFFFKTTEGIYMPYSAKHIFPSSESASALKKKKNRNRNFYEAFRYEIKVRGAYRTALV